MEHTQSIKDISTEWIENLALDELNMEESGIINFDDHLNPVHLIEESSIKLMDLLRERCELYSSKFNQYRGGHNNGSQIRIFKISNTVNDFMLFRNSLRLIFARKANDVISIGFLANGKDIFAARLNDASGRPAISQGQVHEIRAHLGPFNDISWKFQNQTFDIDALTRHYLSEFIRHSAR